MNISNLFRSSTPEPAPQFSRAEQDLDAALAVHQGLHAKLSELAEFDRDARADIDRHQAASVALVATRQRIADAEAARTVRGQTTESVDALTAQEYAQEQALASLDAVARRGEAILRTVAEDRKPYTDELRKVIASLPALQYAVIHERLGQRVAQHAARETAYLKSLAEMFGAAGALNDFASRHPGLGFVGKFDVNDFWFQRPRHELFDAYPLPSRDEIMEMIKTVTGHWAKTI